MVDPRGKLKHDGMIAAREWIRTAPLQEIIDLTASHFEYGMTLNDLIGENYPVPKSADRDFSWGFFKKVKGHTNSQLYSARKRRNAEGNERMKKDGSKNAE